jgi:hypothetical protein
MEPTTTPQPAVTETKVKAAGIAGAAVSLGLTIVLGAIDAANGDAGLRDAVPDALEPFLYGGLATLGAYVAAYRARHTYRS